MKHLLKRHGFLMAVIIINLLVLFFFPQVEEKAFGFTLNNLLNFLLMLTPVFVGIGLLDVWVKKEIMLEIMGEASGLRGILISFLLGLVTAVPLYALLPVAGMLLKKGAKLSNVLIFISSCTSIRIPLLLFEVSSLGLKFTVARLMANILAVLMIAFSIERILTEKDKKSIYEKANKLMGTY